jgi:hypothetical protein
MKFLFLFLGFYLLGLSCLPCSDSKECSTDTGVTVTFSAVNNHQEHNHTREACTPFCTCSCCAASVFYSPLNKIQVIKAIFPSEKYPLFQEDNISDTLNSIWQPPKIAA